MRILITGKNGQLGRSLQDVFAGTDHQIFAYASGELDITDQDQVGKVLTRDLPDIIVNAAAYTAVDKAEDEHEKAFQVNANGAENLAIYAQLANIPLIHISTDYVFDGNGVLPYKTDDATHPQGVYGKSKLAGERAVTETAIKHIVFRTSWVFSEYGHNFVKTMLRLGEERNQLGVVADQYGCPTYAGDLALAIKSVCHQYEQQAALSWGVYHFCGDLATSWHGFARSIFMLAEQEGVLGNRPALNAIESSTFPTSAERPAFSVLDTHSLSELNLVPSNWLVGLKKCVVCFNK
ncbi:dTDP-4-dehydrorhamnose reductase [Marinomonas sp.]